MKMKKCKACGEEMAKSVKICPHCGAKNKKPFFKRWWFWFIVVFICAVTFEGDHESEKENYEDTEEVIPEVELSTDFEKAVWEIVKNNDGKITTIDTIAEEDSEEELVVAAILCENNEEVVNKILSEIAEVVVNNDTNESGIYTFGDIKEGDDATVLVMSDIQTDGTITISSTSSDYNSKRNEWIKIQFSAWDGAHTELEKIIKKNLNDEKSYEHIATSYRDITNESVRDEVNKILEEAGYSARVEIGDLFIITEFSAKNGFGGTVKSVAYGISSYNNNTLGLIAIE